MLVLRRIGLFSPGILGYMSKSTTKKTGAPPRIRQAKKVKKAKKQKETQPQRLPTEVYPKSGSTPKLSAVESLQLNYTSYLESLRIS